MHVNVEDDWNNIDETVIVLAIESFFMIGNKMESEFWRPYYELFVIIFFYVCMAYMYLIVVYPGFV